MLLDLDHEGLLSTLGACTWLDLLESLELELFALLGLSNLVTHGVVSMDLCISLPHVYERRLLSFLSLHCSVPPL